MPTLALAPDRAGCALVEFGKAGIAIGVQMARESCELRAAAFAFAVGSVAIGNGRRRGSGMGSLVAQIYPQPSRLGIAVALR